MKFLTCDLPGVAIIEPDVYRDTRGFFLETYHGRKYREAGIDVDFVQDNHSRSLRGTVRGLHAQRRRPQAKLIRVLQGEIFDVVVDVRRGSPTFGLWIGVVLSAENFRQCYVPVGCVHGFCVTSEVAEVEYKCSDFYDPGDEYGVVWNDPDVGVQWPVSDPVLSQKDRALPRLAEIIDQLPVFEPGGVAGGDG